MSHEQDMKLAHAMQPIAAGLEEVLSEIVGASVRFSVFVWTDDRVQYVANVQRPDVIAALESIIARWRAGESDAPPHAN